MSAGSTLSPAPKPDQEWWPPPQGSWTYDDYARLPDNGMRYEVLEGDLHMSPAPQIRHQQIIGELYMRIRNFLEKRPLGKVFLSPIDVRLQVVGRESTVQPDLVYIRNERVATLTEEMYINGAPDLVIEVLSPNRESYDRRDKFRVYAGAGISEYWIVDPHACTVEVNVLRGEAYAPGAVFAGKAAIRSEALPELAIVTAEIFSPA